MTPEHRMDEPLGEGDALPGTQAAQVRLEPPSRQYIESYFQAMAEFESEGIPQMPANLTREEFPAYVQRLLDQSLGKNLKEGHVPSLELWIIDADGYAGRIILGLTVTPEPDRLGNHIGYAVRPSKRGKGYATQALRCLIDEAKELGICKLMPICDPDNVASRKVIERNGGVLVEGMPVDKARYGGLRFVITVDASDMPER